MSLSTSIRAKFRFPRQLRLLTASQFRSVFKGPIASNDRHFRVKATFNDSSFPRLGLAVSRRVSKRAVVRNRIKRVVRESFRHNQETLTGFDIVVVAGNAAAHTEKVELKAAIERHWQRLLETSKKGGSKHKPQKEY